ncbi:hypothetical protein V6N13_099244 [Hibiscus sabdariffa]
MTYVLDNLMTFLTDYWNLKLKEVAAIVNLQAGLRNMLQIYVALCIDACLGYRWMLILYSLLYSAGLFLLAFSVPKYLLNEDICHPPKLEAQKVIRWFCYGFLILGTITSFYGFISSEENWHQRFLVSTIAIFIGLLWFLCGLPFYGPREMQPSPLSSLMQTVIAALRKRHLNYQENEDNLCCGDGDDQDQHPTGHLSELFGQYFALSLYI